MTWNGTCINQGPKLQDVVHFPFKAGNIFVCKFISEHVLMTLWSVKDIVM